MSGGMSKTKWVHKGAEANRSLLKERGMLDGTKGSMCGHEAIALYEKVNGFEWSRLVTRRKFAAFLSCRSSQR